MLPLLGNDFTYLAETEAADQVLRQCYEIPNGTDKDAALLIDQLYAPTIVQGADPISTNILTKEHIQA
jgi:hypothetical protein